MAKTHSALIAACAWTALLMIVAPCAAGDADDDKKPASDREVALNKSVSIDEVRFDTAVGEKTAGAPREVERNAATPVGTEELPSPLPGSRRLKPARFSRESTGLSKDRKTPWYRTGIGALAIVLVLVGAGTWVMRRWIPATRIADSRALQVVARVGLSPKHSAVLVGLGRRFVLLGVSGDRVTTLCEVCDPDEVAELAARVGAAGGRATGDFDDLLVREAGGYSASAPADVDETASARSGGSPAREPLNDLLRRLRVLQSK